MSRLHRRESAQRQFLARRDAMSAPMPAWDRDSTNRNRWPWCPWRRWCTGRGVFQRGPKARAGQAQNNQAVVVGSTDQAQEYPRVVEVDGPGPERRLQGVVGVDGPGPGRKARESSGVDGPGAGAEGSGSGCLGQARSPEVRSRRSRRAGRGRRKAQESPARCPGGGLTDHRVRNLRSGAVRQPAHCSAVSEAAHEKQSKTRCA